MFNRIFESFRFFKRELIKPDDLLRHLSKELNSCMLSAYEKCIAVTKEKSAIRKSLKGMHTYSQIALSNLRSALHKVETKVCKAFTKYATSEKQAYEAKQAYYDEIALEGVDHLETPLAPEDSKKEVIEEPTQHLPYEQKPAELNTDTRHINASAFFGFPECKKISRLVMAYVTKFSLCRMADQIHASPILWRIFPDLQPPRAKTYQVGIRTNLLGAHSNVKHVMYWISFILALFPEYIIMRHTAILAFDFGSTEAMFFPLFMLGLCKGIAMLLEPSMRRFVRSRPKAPALLKVACTGAILLVLSYGFLTAVRILEDSAKSTLKVTKEKLETLQNEAFDLDYPDPELEASIEETKEEVKALETELITDPYSSKMVIIGAVSISSAVILLTNSLMLCFLTVAGNAVKLRRKYEKAEKLRDKNRSVYDNLRSQLSTARTLYLDFERITWEVIAIDQLILTGPTESNLLDYLELQIKDLENQYNNILTSKNKES